MESIPSRRKLVNTRKRTLEAVRLAEKYGLPVPPILTFLLGCDDVDPERLEEWSPECAGGWIAVAYETAILHAGMRCGRCWECVVYRFDARAEREAGMFDLASEQFGDLYDLAVPFGRWNAERKWLRENLRGWRAWTHPEWDVVRGYTDDPRGEIVRESNWVPRSLRNTKIFLQNLGTSLEDLTIRLPYCRSGGTFQRSDLRIYQGGTQIRPTPSRKRFIEVVETLHGRWDVSISAWDTEQVVANFGDEPTTLEAIRLLKTPHAA